MTKITRKNFFKKACASGACLCGFSALALSNSNEEQEKKEEVKNADEMLVKSWLSGLLVNIDKGLDEASKRKILKSCSIVHYENLKMDEMLAPYVGNLEGFMKLLQESWGWKVDYDKSKQTIMANENKNYCVCPMINTKDNIDKSAICYCSEGFAEKMFSVVSGTSVAATVISSIHRGDETCIYKVVLQS